MGFLRPATPGFLVTLVATALLAAVSFCVPWIQSVYFLKAAFTSDGFSGSITFGTLGYCLQLSNGTTCSKPSIGYELDINGLVGNHLPISIPQVVVKWVTYCLFLHVVALVLAAGAAAFGLLAHVREMAMTCFSTLISGFAAVVALLAFIFDIAFFFLAKARINKVPGGSAVLGNALWLTLAAWVLLFFSGCFYTLGRCCISGRGPSSRRWAPKDDPSGPWASNGSSGYGDQMRLDAVKAEADRKARQEVGLPAFSESQPLKARIEGDEVVLDDDESNPSYHDHKNVGATTAGDYGRRPSPNPQQSAGRQPIGYVKGPTGNRAVDEYYNSNRLAPSAYPPRQPSVASSLSNYSTPSGTSNPPYNPTTSSHAGSTQYLSPYAQYNQQSRYADTTAQTTPYQSYNQSQPADKAPQNYGHAAGGSSYYSAVSHQPYASQYSQYDAAYDGYDANARAPATFNPETYNNTGVITRSPPQRHQSPYLTPSQQQPDRSYTLGGDGYGGNTLPPLPERQSNQNSFLPYPGESHALTNSPPPITTDLPPPPRSNTSPVKGPREPRSPTFTYDDNPPGYEAGPSRPAGAWGSKR